MTDRPLVVVLWLLLSLAPAAPALAGQSSPPEPGWEAYKVIVERNIFVKDRSSLTQRSPSPASSLPQWPQSASRPERDLVLTGIVRQRGEHIAFLENARTGVTFRLRLGDPVAAGRLTRIALDHVVYQSSGKSAAIEVGHNLDGGLASQTWAQEPAEGPGLPPFPSSPGSPSQTPPLEPTAAPDATLGRAAAAAPDADGPGTEDESAVLERLRQQRQKELSEQ